MATILRCISHRSICHLWLISYQEKLTLKASNEIDSPNQFLTLFGSSLAQRRKRMLCWWPSTKYLNQLNCFKYSSTSKYFSLNGEDIRLMLWDTAGQEEFDCITRAYYRWNLAKKLFELDHFFLLKIVTEEPRLVSLPSLVWTESLSNVWPSGRRRWRRSAETSPWCWSWPSWTSSTGQRWTALKWRSSLDSWGSDLSRPQSKKISMFTRFVYFKN